MSAGRILESAMTTDSGSAHATLLRNPEGAYTRLVTAQRFQEEGECDDNDDESGDDTTAPVGVGLTREQADEIARNEKPMFETIKRTGTGRSAASLQLENQRNADLEAGSKSTYSFWYLFRRLLTLNRESKWDYVVRPSTHVLMGTSLTLSSTPAWSPVGYPYVWFPGPHQSRDICLLFPDL